MKGSFLYALVPSLSVALLSACFDAKFDQHLDALSESETAAAGTTAASDSTGELTTECEGDDRLGGSCSAVEGVCQREGVYICEQGEVVCDATVQAADRRTEPCEAGPEFDCDGVNDKAAEGACCTDADCGSTGRCVVAEAAETPEDGSQSWGVCTEPLDDGAGADESKMDEQATDFDAGVPDVAVIESESEFPAWEPVLCEASTEDCRCFRGVCLPDSCTDYDPADFASGVLINEETPQLGVPICYPACQQEADCPAELPVCVADTHIWADDAERAKGCFAR